MFLSVEEILFIKQLAKWFNENKAIQLDREEVMKKLNLDSSRYEVLIQTMESMGIIEEISSYDGCYAGHFNIRPYVVQFAREIEKNERESTSRVDIIEQVKNHVRKSPWTAWPIIVFLGLSLLISFLNSLVELIEKIRNWFK